MSGERLDELLRSVVREEVCKALDEREAERAVAPAPRPHVSPLIDTAEAAALAGVTPETIRRWIRNGQLTPRKAGRLFRIAREELMGLMRSTGGRCAEDDDINGVVESIWKRSGGPALLDKPTE